MRRLTLRPAELVCRNHRSRRLHPVGWTSLVLATVALLSVAPRSATGNEAAGGQGVVQVSGETERGPVRVALNVKDIESRIQQIEAGGENDDATKSQLLDVYRKTIESLTRAEAFREQSARFEEIITDVPNQLRDSRSRLESSANDVKAATEEEITLAELEQQLTAADATLAEKRKNVSDCEAAPKRRAERRVEIPRQLVALRDSLSVVRQRLDSPVTEETPLARAHRNLLVADEAVIVAEIDCYERELASYDARTELLPLRRQVAAQELTRADRRAKTLREEINRRRTDEATQQAKQAQRQAAVAHPLVKELAESNAELAATRTSISADIDRTSTALDDADRERKRVQTDFEKMRERVDRSGLNSTMGSLLRKYRESLPDTRTLTRRIRDRAGLIQSIQLAQYEIDDERVQYFNVEAELETRLGTVEESGGGMDRWLVENTLKELITQRGQICESLMADYDRYFRDLVELDTVERELLAETTGFAEFIDERVLWIPSAATIQVADLTTGYESVQEVLSVRNWRGIATALRRDVRAHPFWYSLAICVFVGLMAMVPSMKRTIGRIGEAAIKPTFAEFTPTLVVLALTVMASVPLPAIMGFTSWRFLIADDMPEIGIAIGSALQVAAVGWFALRLLQMITRPHGLAVAHFNRSTAATAALSRLIRLMTVSLLPLFVMVEFFEVQTDDAWRHTLGRACFFAMMLAMVLVGRRLAHPTWGVISLSKHWNSGHWLYRLRRFWHSLVYAIPLATIGLAASGYYYSAVQLTRRGMMTGYVVAGLVIVYAIALRALLLARRRLAMQQARERRAAALAAAQKQDVSPGAESLPVPAEEPMIDLSVISQQTRKLLVCGILIMGTAMLWGIWSDMLPALAILDRIELDADEVGNVITLTDALVAVLVGVMTVVACRNVPGLMEMALLQRLPLAPSTRFAITTVANYLIGATGLVLAFQRIGIGWNSVQWLVAAMTVGLGFGLQEIFANFVSGLIILFEKPIRVGDVVTVGDVTGAVTRIRTRATTITNWDRKELIIPNKQFVTSEVMNWTLSDQVNRIVITVGVAYGTEADKVLALLQQVADEHPLVMKDPMPRVTFEEFGASSLNFLLRVYIPNLDERLQTITDLHRRIQVLFKEAGIEIAFPQQDIHVRSIDHALLPLTANSERPSAEAA